MNDIVQSQEKSMEGHLQFLFKVRGLKSKIFRNKVRSTNEILWGVGWGFKSKQSHGGNLDIFWNCTLLYVKNVNCFIFCEGMDKLMRLVNAN